MMAARIPAAMRIMPGSAWGLVPHPERPMRLMAQPSYSDGSWRLMRLPLRVGYCLRAL
jgi:hypothetical protein